MPRIGDRYSEHIKLVLVGNEDSGKSSMIRSFFTNGFSTKYEPTIYDVQFHPVNCNGHLVDLNIYDTAGQTAHSRLRPLCYPNTDAFLICFQVVSLASVMSVRQWIKEIRHQCRRPNIFLVGTKIDLRNDPTVIDNLQGEGNGPITVEQGRELAEEVNAVSYYECSARSQVGIKDVFHGAIQFVLNNRPLIVSRPNKFNVGLRK